MDECSKGKKEPQLSIGVTPGYCLVHLGQSVHFAARLQERWVHPGDRERTSHLASSDLTHGVEETLERHTPVVMRCSELVRRHSEVPAFVSASQTLQLQRSITHTGLLVIRLPFAMGGVDPFAYGLWPGPGRGGPPI